MESDRLNQLIEALEDAVDSANPLKTKWRPIWEQIKRISVAFKDTRYPTRNERQERCNHFQSLVQKVKKMQAEERDKWDEKSHVSKRHKDEILSCAAAATPSGPLSDFIFSLVTLPVLPVKAALNAILPGGEIDEKHEELKSYSRKLREGWDLISEHKDEMTGHDKKEAFQALKEAQESLNAAWESWKQSKSQTKKAWDEHFRAKREDFEDRVRNRIATHKESLEKLYSVLSKCEAHLDDLRSQRGSAWSDSFRDRVEGWMDEERDRIESIKEKIARIEGWLEEDRGKLK